MVGRSGTHQGKFITATRKAAEKAALRISVPARKVPGAADRNRIKRWLRELWRRSRFSKERNTLFDVRIVRADGISFKALQEELVGAEASLLTKVPH